MRRYFGIIATVILALSVLIGLSATGSIEFDRPQESEIDPIRSSYSSGPTGLRAFYQLLEESGRPVRRWRENFQSLSKQAGGAVLVCAGPYQFERGLPEADGRELRKWVSAGGRALIVSRHPLAQFGDPVIHSEPASKTPPPDATPELLVDESSDRYIVQPTELTRGIRGLALSHLATRLRFYPPDEDEEAKSNNEGTAGPDNQPSPTPTPESEEEGLNQFLYAPVIHIGDDGGAILADFNYGKGRVIFLSDPFVIANNGISRGANLQLALNIVDALGREEGASPRTIIFDEFHHGYFSRANPLVDYFKGTPMPWLIGHGLLVCLILVYTAGRRFARPLPLPTLDRHSPLEFVGSMANLQMVASARELAIENIYPRFKTALCRRLGISSRAGADEIAAVVRRRRLPVNETELRRVLAECELVLGGEKMDDQTLVETVSTMRRMMAEIGK